MLPDSIYRTIASAVNAGKFKRTLLINSIKPTKYDISMLSQDLNYRKKSYNKLDLSINDAADSPIFQTIYMLYERAKAFEKNNDVDSALFLYIVILMNFVPIGTAYYERPAIILEKKKEYESAIIICELFIKAYGLEKQPSLVSPVPDFEHRIERLKRKQAACKPKNG